MSLKLTAAQDQYTTAKHILIGHSHGGSIILNAVQQQHLPVIAGVACLATPVLNARSVQLDPVSKFASYGVPAVLLTWASLGILAVFGIDVDKLSENASTALFLTLFICGLGIGWIARLWAISLDLSNNDVAIPSDRVIFVRAPGDEASGLISATHLIAFLIDRVTTTPMRAIHRAQTQIQRARELAARRPIISTIIILALIAAFVAPFLQNSAKPSDIQVVVQMSALLLLAISFAILIEIGWQAKLATFTLSAVLMAPTFILLAALGLVAGPEMAIASLVYRISSEPTPPGRWTLLDVSDTLDNPINNTQTVLQHSSVYQAPAAIKAICDWTSDRISHSSS
ncbi:hypothetical protein A4A58_13300 [Tardiphaga robiniae]|uniref:Alpha/beta hydrolase n=1 Tax=Tardiphaga robiniae TaxID=943830 RepID=A0A163XTQ5_9BRAD|nr:hypothetical protein A4A58_13300 [Tardiphaga robiniae]